MRALRQIIMVVFATLFVEGAQAHHSRFYKPLFKVVKAKDLKSAKAMFSLTGWKGSDESIPASTLQDRLNKAGEITYLNEYTNVGRPRTRVAIIFKLPTKEKKSVYKWISLLGEHPGTRDSVGAIKGDDWRVVRIVEGLAETEKYLGRKLDHLGK